MTERIVIVGGPRSGKSWLANGLASGEFLLHPARLRCPVYCGDPLSKVKEPVPGVNYLPENIPFSGDDGAAQWVADHWFTMPGPWVCEGHVMARALRRWLRMFEEEYDDNGIRKPFRGWPCDRIIVLEEQRPELDLLPGQVRMHKGVMTVWKEIAPYFEGMYETRRWT